MKSAAIFTFFILVFAVNAQPTFNWAKQFGTTNTPKMGQGITVDANDNVYSTGFFDGTVDFDPGPGVYTLTSIGWDVYVSKLDATGNFLWAKSIPANSQEIGYGIAVDASGVYVSYENELTVLKFDVSGNLFWTKSFGGSGSVWGLTLDADGNVYTTGRFTGTVDFDPNAGVYNLTTKGNYDIFVSKMNSSGNFLWAKSVGGTDGDYGGSIATDNNGNVYFTGSFMDTVDFDPGAGIYNMISNGKSDICLGKLDSVGNFLWAKQIGGQSWEYGSGVIADINNDVFLTASFHDTIDVDPGIGTYSLVAAGLTDIFVEKLDASGNFIWGKQMGGTDWESTYRISTDRKGNVYTTGTFEGVADFDPGPGMFNLSSAGYTDIFVSKLDAMGNFFCAGRMGGKYSDLGYSIDVDKYENILTTGVFADTADFDPGTGSYNLISNSGYQQTFVSKLNCGSLATGEYENEKENAASVFPNPSSGKFELSAFMNDGIVKVINVTGQVVIEKANVRGTNFVIDITNCPAGIYFLEASQSGKVSRAKLVKD